MLTLTTLFWSGNAIAGKLAVGEISPLLLTWVRWTIAALVMGAIARHRIARDWPAIRVRLPYLALMGAVGFTVFNGLFYTGLITTTAINATIIQAAMPMFIFALNLAIFRTSVRALQLVGYALTLLGVAVAAGQGSLAALADLAVAPGDFLIIGASVLYAAYTVSLARKPLMHWQSFLAALLVAASTSAVPLVAVEAMTQHFVPPTTPTAWAIIAYTAIFPSILAQAFYIRGNEILGSNTAGLFLNLIPIMGAILSVLLLGERFQLFHATSLVLVLGGIAMAQASVNKSKGARPS